MFTNLLNFDYFVHRKKVLHARRCMILKMFSQLQYLSDFLEICDFSDRIIV